MAAAVEVAETCGGRRGVTIFGIGADENNWIRFRKAGAVLNFELAIGGETSAEQIDYDAEAHRWWRLSHTPGHLNYQTSSDGTAWAIQLSVPQPVWIDNIHIELQAGSEVSDETEALKQATFSSFSLARA